MDFKNGLAQAQLDAAKASIESDAKIRNAMNPDVASGKSKGITDNQVREQQRQLDIAFLKDTHAQKMMQLKEEDRAAIQNEMRRREEIAKITDMEKKAAETKKLAADEDRRRYDYQKKRIEENAKFELELKKQDVERFKAAEEEKTRFILEQKEKEKAKAEAEKQRLQGAFDARGFMNAQDPQKVMRALQDARAKEEQAAQAQKDNSLWRPGMIGDDIESRRRRFEANQRAAAQRGRRSAYNDAENGNLQQGEVDDAQAKVSEQVLGTQVKQGQLNQAQGKVLVDMIRSQADQQNAIDNMMRLMGQLGQAQKGLTQATSAAARNTASQVGSLGN